jgi:mannitol/fructose-specific phosphotransferase system IIA component (Ntr-type)
LQFVRYIRPELVRLEFSKPPEPPEDVDPGSPRWRWRLKEHVIDEMMELFVRSGCIRNESKFRRDYVDRETKGSTAIGEGIAIPHVRSMQPRRIVVCVARSTEGVEYLALDGKPVHILFGITGPTYEEQIYLKAYAWIARLAREPSLTSAVMSARTEDEIVAALRSFQ